MAGSVLWAVGALAAGVLQVFTSSTGSINRDLGPLLSQEAQIYLPGSEGFSNATTRWSAAARPDFKAIVKVKTEADVQHTIKYANEHNYPFLAISGGHGQTSALNNIHGGIGIWMRGMKGVKISHDGGVASVQGGIENGELVRALWSQGKQTVTTGCDCAGFIGPVMGGGHGWLQGRYGLPADNLMSARMVLANTTVISVSETSHKDLFWAIRGAGHNFGIFTEIDIKVYDRRPEQDQWAALGLTFTHDKLEKVFAIANSWLQSPNRPVELTHYGTVSLNPDINIRMPVITFWIYWQGSTIPKSYTEPLYALNPVSVDSSVTDLAGVNTHLAAAYGMAACWTGYSRQLYPVSLNSWPLANLRGLLEIFASMPSAFRSSIVLLEAYATNRVSEIPSESISYPDRGGQLLISPLLTYAANASLDEEAFSIGKRIRNMLLNGIDEPLIAYVNYAHGDESLEAVYGYESWRLEKLRRLKAEYDPHKKFNFYVPIT
ncbi:FAD-binding domain-containing protein [Lindgomyces ingoldianus]|uniref:FAD-binding domain-containing protein n=1 Tax=Lindgomyces ingoldianus TaxID=673940 RepID=A0ACB6R0M9_9PLEO|nr:FAD-binding domain-containing protein [Lindgomyces ingoldianus]KAF2471875.1 FAD-binding domain-containing protein [Lindgomyces ingoldianus]